jgi:hypothetical protein
VGHVTFLSQEVFELASDEASPDLFRPEEFTLARRVSSHVLLTLAKGATSNLLNSDDHGSESDNLMNE